ncbi:CheR family methyltransferase [Legionella worsleiensis]|uniref:Chemotaxis protein methyltransferase n=1 Tax=Legionella worsleiensis TaxID=45076 RepID=A0A0W1A4G6_9GAMM|nr:protein-glutamate O-methyltransferase CheR [Legionella worsleiensis]KTD76198.1 methyltransferase involved in chemotaxis (CheR domain) [Legionella worsleiensis]STY33226.1 methyltransferase involved in chemotaxis (CheR domain) [Legionella worsleiensis]
MNTTDFEFIRKFINEQAAIVLEPGKEYLVESRLTPLAKESGFSSLDELINEIKFRPTEELKMKIVDSITINETLFFRDIHPFEILKKTILPELVSKKTNKTLNIWCAAASSGQEPYTIAMILKELKDSLGNWSINFLASDISDKMIARAKKGVYNQLEVNRGLPAPYLVKYFDKKGSDWQIKDEIRSMVNFQKLNLKNPWSIRQMDLIFMRNVLIYFSVETKKEIFKRVSATLHPDGYFFLGGSETTLGISTDFERIGIDKVPCYKLKK